MLAPTLPGSLAVGVGRILGSFAFLHAANAVLAMVFSLSQLIVFSRVFDTRRFSEIVLLTAVGIYALPLSQALGRANFVALRGGQTGTIRAAAAALLLHGVLLAIVAGLSPCLVAPASPREAFESAFYVAACLANNVWYYDLQTTFWALDRGKSFERLTIIRRLTTFGALPLLWFTGDFLLFATLILVVTIAFAALLPRMLPPSASPRGFRAKVGELRLQGVADYLLLFWPALMSSLTELVVLNSPYALFNAAFGTGPALIAYDAIMKLARIAMTVARNLSESALPRLTRMFASRDKAALGRLLGLVFGLCGLEGLGIAAMLIGAGPTVFHILLGPNNVLPADAPYVAATVVLAGCVYTPAAYFLAFNGARAAIHRMTLAAAVGLVGFGGLVLSGRLDLVGALWAYAVYFVCIAALTTTLAVLLVRRLAGADGASTGAAA